MCSPLLSCATAVADATRRFLARTPLAPPLAAAAASIAATLSSPVWWSAAAAAMLLPLLAGYRKTACCALLAALCCSLHLACDLRQAQQARDAWLNPPGKTLDVAGTIARTFHSTALLREESTGRFVELAGPLLPPANIGERWCIEGFSEEFSSPVFPGEFDRKAWLESLGCICRVGVTAARPAGEGSWPYRVLGWAESFRDSLARSMSRGVDADSPEYRVLVSLVLGEKNRADPETIDIFRRSGCLHAFAVSGLHVGLLALLLGGALRLLRCPPRLSGIILLVVPGFYLFVTGFPVSAVRAYAMIAVWLGARLLRRPCTPANTWCAAALLVLLIDPSQLFQAGFQLSFSIYAVIVAGSCVLARTQGWWAADSLIPRRLLTPQERLRNRVGAWARGLVSISLLAWLASLPITAAHFGSVSLYGFAANVMIAPLLPAAMGCGLVSAAVSGMPALLPWVNKTACAAAGLLLHTAAIPAAWPGSYLSAECAAPADAAAILAFDGNSTACVLGNPGIILHDSSENDARFRLVPALFRANYAPTVLVPLRPGAWRSEGPSALRQAYPGLSTLSPAALSERPIELRTAAGVFTIFPPAVPAHRSTADDRAPAVLWERGGHRLLYAGNASLNTLRRLPPGYRRADCLIIGSHLYHTALDCEWIASTGARRVYLLPEATQNAKGFSLEGTARLIRLRPHSYTPLRLSEL